MLKILAIDPGTTESAYIFWDGEQIMGKGIVDNDYLLNLLRGGATDVQWTSDFSLVAVEMVACYGMAVGKEVFETCLVIGRIQEIAEMQNCKCSLIYRRDVKMHHCQSVRAKDGNVRQALIDKYGEPGTKKNPGFTYGITSHLWQAFAISTFLTERHSEQTK